jgi:hypothetical protein
VPSVSRKQHNLMAMVAHDPAAAKRLGIPQSVGKEFTSADKGRKFSRGGEMAESKKMVGKEVAFMKAKGAPKSMIKHEESEMKKMSMGGGPMMKKGMTTAKMGKVKTAAPSRDGVAVKGKTKGTMVKMAGGKGMNKGGRAC